MCNKDHLIGYLYDELSPSELTTFETHLAGCAACRREVDALSQTKQHLLAWSPPEPEFNFTVVQTNRQPSASPRPRWSGLVPRWALAAAATLLLVAGAAALANLDVHYGRDGSLVVRTGWSARPPAADAADASRQAAALAAASEALKSDLLVLSTRLQSIEQSLKDVQAAEQVRVASAGRAGIGPADLRKILAEREARFRIEMAAHTAQIWKDFSAARVNDWTRAQQLVGQAQGFTNRQLQQQRESIDSLRYLHTVSQQR